MGDKTNIFLVRHGDKSLDNKGLTKRGREQARLLGKRLSTMSKRKKGTTKTMEKIIIDRIISSDLPRCKETAEIINKFLKKKIIYEPALREIKGIANSSPFKYRKEKKAIGKFYKNLLKEKGNILIVSSGNVNKNIISRVWKISPKKVWMGHYATGLNHFTIDKNGKTNILCLNDSSHLTDTLKISTHGVENDLRKRSGKK